MKNREYYKDEIVEAVIKGNACGFKKEHVYGGDCGNVKCGAECYTLAGRWMNEEYNALDWNNVPVGTPVWVWVNDEEDKAIRVYAGLMGDKITTFENGQTSGERSWWDNAKLVEPGELYIPKKI